VRFAGSLGQADVRNLLRAADAFVQTSLYEGQSNAVLEAMHEGLPIVVSDIPEQRETVADEETGELGGLLAPLDDRERWIDALTRIRDDRALRQDLAQTAQALVARRFTLEKMVDRFEAVLQGEGTDVETKPRLQA
jgi:glycosyltransferase involved in cell wall biosynthesis